MLKVAGRDFVEDRVFTLSGALAFYTALSLAPIVIIVMYVGGLLGPETQEQFLGEVRRFLGPSGDEAVGLVVEEASEELSTGSVSAMIGLATLVFSATAVFVQLQYTMNWIWGVEADPGQGMVKEWLQKRVLSLAMVLAICFLLLVSLVISAVLRVIFRDVTGLWLVVDNLVTLGVYLLLFTLMFRYVPDVRIPWKDAVRGGAVTAGLFAVGRLAVGRYLGYSSVSSAYGAAGSLIALLVWVYYSALIVFLGVELTQAYVKLSGRTLVPEGHAKGSHAMKTGAKRDDAETPVQDVSPARCDDRGPEPRGAAPGASLGPRSERGRR